jgi:metal-responsive CopG/Arc/MetJ family transcriptional regulator
MRTAKTVSITLPPDLLVKAQEFAQREHRTMSELFREALRRYMAGDEWDALLKRTRARGEALGITTESDVERLSDIALSSLIFNHRSSVVQLDESPLRIRIPRDIKKSMVRYS